MKTTEFALIASYLTHPLVLIGFVLMLVFEIHKLLLNTGILPVLTKKEGSRITRLLLKYGFWLGVTVLLLGGGLQFFQDWFAASTSGK